MIHSATPISAYLNFNKLHYEPQPLSAVPLNLSQIYKPALSERQQYKYLKDKLDSYTKKTSKVSKIDNYEIRTYEKLFQLMYDLASIDNEEIIAHQLGQIKTWLEEQERIIKSRVKQGLERFNVTKESRRAMSLIDKIQSNRPSPDKKMLIPSEIIEETLAPYIRKWRTFHLDSDLPVTRLNHYQRRLVDIDEPKTVQKEEKKYSMLNKNTSYLLNSELEAMKNSEEGKDKEIMTQEGMNASIVETGFLEEVPFSEDAGLPDEIPMFGEDVDEEESRQENDNNDLIPKTKLYLTNVLLSSNGSSLKDKSDSVSKKNKHFIDYESEKQIMAQDRLQLKFDRSRKSEIMRKKEDGEIIDHMSKMVKNKSSVVKQQQKKLELKSSIPIFAVLKEDTTEEFKLSDNLERRYGLTQAQTARTRNQVDLGFSLPKVNTGRNSVNIERSVEKPALNILKKRFSEVLQLSSQTEHEHEDSAPKSLAQYTSQKKIFSNLMEDNNQKSYRQQQLNQLESLRDRLNVNRLNMNLQTLVNGLCPPQENHFELNEIPEKKLLHNEFMVDTKKNKKKKK